jgi:hypothetical protein
MEVPGRDVTADPLEPQPEPLPPDAPRREETRPGAVPAPDREDGEPAPEAAPAEPV